MKKPTNQSINMSTNLLYLYLKKVTKLTQRERVMVLCWLKMLINPKIVMAPSKEDIDRILEKGENRIKQLKAK
jgi:hypothetical protein